MTEENEILRENTVVLVPRKATKQPIRALRDFIRDLQQHCLPHLERNKAHSHRLVLDYCKKKLPKFNVPRSSDWRILTRHQHWWECIEKKNGRSAAFVAWCQIIGDSSANHHASSSSCHAIYKQPLENLERTLERDMGDERIATYIWYNGAPKIFYEQRRRATEESQGRRHRKMKRLSSIDSETNELFHEVLDWWLQLIKSWSFQFGNSEGKIDAILDDTLEEYIKQLRTEPWKSTRRNKKRRRHRDDSRRRPPKRQSSNSSAHS